MSLASFHFVKTNKIEFKKYKSLLCVHDKGCSNLPLATPLPHKVEAGS